MPKTILVVTNDFYAVQDLKQMFPEYSIEGCYRDYQVEDLIRSQKPDLVLTNGLCKTRIEEDHGKPVTIFYNPRSMAKKFGVPVHSVWWFVITEKIKKVFNRKTCTVS